MVELNERERILQLENNHKTLMDKLDDILKRFNQFEEKLDKALEKKADVWVEKAISWAVYIIMGLVLTALIYLILKTDLQVHTSLTQG